MMDRNANMNKLVIDELNNEIEKERKENKRLVELKVLLEKEKNEVIDYYNRIER